MKQSSFVIAFLLVSTMLFAQKQIPNEFTNIDRKALQLPDSMSNTTERIADYITSNFKTDKEKARAIFIWTATNIQYDIANMFAINFYEQQEEKIAKALKTRKGICENYAAVFYDVAVKSGLKCFIVEGYTRQNGFTDYIPHAWCAALIDSAWYMFDPTWGSGYVSNGKFFRKINNDYFKATPATLIRSHMPFDFLWEFLNYPVTAQEFYESKTALNKLKPFFNYTDSIKLYQSQDHIDQLKATAGRIERNGIKNALIFDRLQHIKLEIEQDRQTRSTDLYNAAAHDYNEGIIDFNDFIAYRNKQFIPAKTDDEIQKMISDAAKKLDDAKTKLDEIQNADVNIISASTQLSKSINDAKVQVKEQQDWLKVYFSKGRSGRRSMFVERKVTFFGIPVN